MATEMATDITTYAAWVEAHHPMHTFTDEKIADILAAAGLAGCRGWLEWAICYREAYVEYYAWRYRLGPYGQPAALLAQYPHRELAEVAGAAFAQAGAVTIRCLLPPSIVLDEAPMWLMVRYDGDGDISVEGKPQFLDEAEAAVHAFAATQLARIAAMRAQSA